MTPPLLRPRLDARRLRELATVRDLASFAAWRRTVSGRPAAVDGLAAALAQTPALERAFYETLLPQVAGRIHDLATDFSDGVPLLVPGRPARLRLRRAAMAGLGAHLLFGTLPDAATVHPELPPNRLDRVLADPLPAVVAKLSCWLQWLADAARAAPRGWLSLERRVAVGAPSLHRWTTMSAPLRRLELQPDHAGIEEATGCLQVDFANRYPGGGVLGRGCVQEELRFAMSPDLLATTLLCPAMSDDEAITVHGAPLVARLEGYAWSARYAGPRLDPAPVDGDGTPDVDVVVLDALPMPRGADLPVQLRPALRHRELTKAWVGFSPGADGRRNPIATGNWGCGAFGGHLPLKAVLQWLAASAHGRDLRYHP
ncbi:MAG: hypothetical protein D6798_13760, partial [Deltaproteobacteria bacterium]